MPSIIVSPVQKINDLRIFAMVSSKPIKAKKIIQVEGTLLVHGEDGKVYSNRFTKHGFYRLMDWGHTSTFMRALWLIGIITHKELRQHLAAIKESEHKRTYESNLSELIAACRRLKVVLTKAQMRQLKKTKP